MRLCKIFLPDIGAVYAALDDDERLYPLYDPETQPYRTLAAIQQAASESDETSLSDFVERFVAGEGLVFADFCRVPQPDNTHLLPPIDQQEVWAAGVTYTRSRDARMEESNTADIYERVYDSERPELFFKATPSRVVGPYDSVAIRQDANWNVPEPELALVLDKDLQLVGFTICDDVSSRDIEGENPLYLPQAKVYRKACALGPAIYLTADLPERIGLEIKLKIEREKEVVFEGSSNSDRLHRTLTDLVRYLGYDNVFPDGVILSTGTGIVPPDEFSLTGGEIITIEIEKIGQLITGVEQKS